jgi:hypothetical protein
MTATKTHLLDPSFEFPRTYCGCGGVTFSAPVTSDLAEATCKTCCTARRNLDRLREARAIARRVKP